MGCTLKNILQNENPEVSNSLTIKNHGMSPMYIEKILWNMGKRKKNHPTYLLSLAFAKLKVFHKTYLFYNISTKCLVFVSQFGQQLFNCTVNVSKMFTSVISQ